MDPLLINSVDTFKNHLNTDPSSQRFRVSFEYCFNLPGMRRALIGPLYEVAHITKDEDETECLRKIC